MSSSNLVLVNRILYCIVFVLLFNFRMPFCGITEIGCDYLVRALRSNPDHLKELDLNYNHPGKLGMQLMSGVQKDIEHLTVRYNSESNISCCFVLFLFNKLILQRF